MVIATPTHSPSPDARERLPRLENGDRLDQPTFHARYLAMPEGTRAELIGGIVFLPSPVSKVHMRTARRVFTWLTTYEDATPGTEALAEGTVILGPESEPEPDLFLRILPEHGGSTSDTEEDEYVIGAPELVVEIAASRESVDLHGKKADYEAAGVQEYIAVALRQREVHWFALEDGRYTPLAPGSDGLLRSRRFPGLWLDPQALLRGDLAALRATLRRGLESPDHTAWVRTLAGRTPGN